MYHQVTHSKYVLFATQYNSHDKQPVFSHTALTYCFVT